MDRFKTEGRTIIDPFGDVVAVCNGTPPRDNEEACSAEDVAQSMCEFLNIGVASAIAIDRMSPDGETLVAAR